MSAENENGWKTLITRKGKTFFQADPQLNPDEKILSTVANAAIEVHGALTGKNRDEMSELDGAAFIFIKNPLPQQPPLQARQRGEKILQIDLADIDLTQNSGPLLSGTAQVVHRFAEQITYPDKSQDDLNEAMRRASELVTDRGFWQNLLNKRSPDES